MSDVSTDEDIIRRAVSSAMTVARYMSLHPASEGYTDEAAVARVSTQLMRLVFAVLSRTNEAGKSGRVGSSPL